jgi:serine/threonine-protein kinase
MPALAVSADGESVAFVARLPRETTSRLYLRRMHQLTATALPGTDFGHTPFFSPDGRWIGYFAKGKLQKVSVTGGAPIALGDAEVERGATWGEDDVITYAPVAATGGRLLRVPAAGGTSTPLGPFVQGHVTQRWPQALPGNRAILYTGHSSVDSFEDACLVVQMLDGGAPRTIECGGYGWRYVPTGHVLYVHGGTMFAAPFDLDRLAIEGTGVPVIEGVMASPTSGSVQVALSSAGSGLLAYAPGESTGTSFPLDVMDRTGKVTPLPAPPMNWDAPNYSPDGKLIALSVLAANKQPDVWVYDVGRNTSTRLTFSEGQDIAPVFTPDGRRIAYGSGQGGAPNLFWRATDGSGEEERLATSGMLQAPGAWTPDGKTLIFMQSDPKRQTDLWVLPMLPDGRGGLKPGTPKLLLGTPANEVFPALSPDGKWLSYMSDESGTTHVYVRPFDGAPGKWQISTDSAVWSAWSRKGKELVFGGGDGRLQFVTYEAVGSTFRASRAQSWSPGAYIPRALSSPFALHPDGQRVVTASQAAQFPAAADRVVLVTNFFAEIRAKTGVRSKN